MGRCWHAGLLWALETLPWAPARLTRVALVLARLTRIEIEGGNTPHASLVNIFRSWCPQTAANIDQRIAVLDTVITREPDAAFDMLDSLVYMGNDSAIPSDRPIWRDDDAGAGYGVRNGEWRKMLQEAADRLIACSEGHSQRIARLIEKSLIFDEAPVNAILTLAERVAKSSASDEDREVIRAALRKKIHWHRNYDEARGKAIENKLRAVEDLYERISPRDPVVRYRWLFAGGRDEIPVCVRNDYKKQEEIMESQRLDALREIHAERGMKGIEQIAAACVNEPSIGIVLAKLEFNIIDLADYQTQLSERAGNLSQWQQLLAITRAILVVPGILIPDEATSSVDTRTEAHIQKALLRLMEGRTSFVIAHRLRTIRDAESVVNENLHPLYPQPQGVFLLFSYPFLLFHTNL